MWMRGNNLRKIGLTLLAGAVMATAVGLRPLPSDAAGATLYLSPSSKTVREGDSFSVSVYVRSTTDSINAADAVISFPKDILRVNSLSSGGIFSLWAETPKFSNSTGRITFSGGLPSPGYKGSAGRIITISFRAVNDGRARVSFVSASVLRNDENGTNILASTGSGTYTVAKQPPTNLNTNTSTPTGPTAPIISSTTNPDPTKWYRVCDLKASWRGGTGVQGYAVVFDQAASTIPAARVTNVTPSFSRTCVTDGIWYLHIRAQYESGWSRTATFAYRVDTKPPEPFTLEVVGDPQVKFNTTDATSGVDRYEAAIDGGAFTIVQSPYQTPELSVGKHKIVVRAYDKAGNYREATAEFEIFGYPQPIIIDLTPVLLGGEPIVIHGQSNAQDSLRLTIDGVDYGPFPVADHLDSNPPRPATEGKTAWKLEVRPNVAEGLHELTMISIGPNGERSDETIPVTFRVVAGMIRIGPWLIPIALVLNILLILFVLATAIAVYYAIRYHRLRRQTGGVKKTPKPSDVPPPVTPVAPSANRQK